APTTQERRLIMIVSRMAARALPLLGGLAILGLGGLLPLVPSWAQAPREGDQSPAAQDPTPSDQGRDRLQALEKAQADIRRMHREVEQARQDLERRTQELTRKLDQVRKAAVEAAKAPPAVERKSLPARGVPAGQPGGVVAAPGTPSAAGGAANPGTDLDKRLR